MQLSNQTRPKGLVLVDHSSMRVLEPPDDLIDDFSGLLESWLPAIRQR
jgi:hypothetical protein